MLQPDCDSAAAVCLFMDQLRRKDPFVLKRRAAFSAETRPSVFDYMLRPVDESAYAGLETKVTYDEFGDEAELTPEWGTEAEVNKTYRWALLELGTAQHILDHLRRMVGEAGVDLSEQTSGMCHSVMAALEHRRSSVDASAVYAHRSFAAEGAMTSPPSAAYGRRCGPEA